VRTVAAKLRVPVVGGSDAHFWAQVGIKATVLPVDELTQTSVASEIRTGRAAVESQSYGPIAVQISGSYKRIAKARAARAAAAYRDLPVTEVPVSEMAGRAQ